MNFGWGKALFYFFLGCMAITSSSKSAADIPIGIIFFVATVLLAFISLIYRKEESKRIEENLKKLEESQEKANNENANPSNQA